MMTESENILQCDQLVLNKALKTVEYQGRGIKLSPTSFELLSHLMQKSPSVVSVDELLEHVWQQKVVNKETVKQQIKSLRDQLGSAASLVESVRGFGYQIKPQKNTEESKKNNQNKNSKYKQFWLAFELVLIILLVIVMFNHYNKPSLSLPIKTATLPFKLLDSSDQDLVLLLQEELTNMLAREEGVRAISVSAMEHASDENYSLQEYGELLNVDMIFEGSIQEQPAGYQVKIRMVWTKNSIAVWRDSISIAAKDRQLLLEKTTAALQSFIAKKVTYIKNRNS